MGEDFARLACKSFDSFTLLVDQLNDFQRGGFAYGFTGLYGVGFVNLYNPHWAATKAKLDHYQAKRTEHE